jgi:hypothetical protein
LFRHYQTFGGLPVETRGGKRTGSSYLDNEDVFQRCRAWLLQQELGTVTPENFNVRVGTHEDYSMAVVNYLLRRAQCVTMSAQATAGTRASGVTCHDISGRKSLKLFLPPNIDNNKNQ